MTNAADHQTSDVLPADRVVDGQAFTAVGRTPYTTRDGREIELVVWRSRCETCGADFEVTVGESNPKFNPSRRCLEHRSRPRGDQRRKLLAAAVRAALEADPTLERSFDGWCPDWALPPEVL